MRGLRISEVADLIGLSQRAIRFYEERGLVQPERDGLNCRRYDIDARERLHLIAQLRRAGLGLDQVQAILEAEADGPTAQFDCMVEQLHARSAHLERLRAEIESLITLVRLKRSARAEVGLLRTGVRAIE